MTYRPDNFTVWTEIPVTDLGAAVAFYNAVTDAGLEIDDNGPNPMAMFRPKDPSGGVAGHLYPGKPAADGSGPTVHLAAPGRLEDTLERVRKAGGQVVSEPIALPVGRFAYIRDPDGNSIGVFETP